MTYVHTCNYKKYYTALYLSTSTHVTINVIQYSKKNIRTFIGEETL